MNKHLRFLFLLINLLAITCFACREGPENARKKLESMGIPYTEGIFLEKVGERNTDVVKLFLQAGMKDNKQACRAALWQAVDGDHAEMVEALVQNGADANIAKNGVPLLLFAIGSYGNPQIVKALIGAKADVNARSERGSTCLTTAISSTQETEIVKMLIRAGADVNAPDMPLIHAASTSSNNGLEIVRELIKAGAGVNLQNSEGETALHHAVLLGNLDTIKALIDAGAGLNIHANNGDTPLGNAVSSRKSLELVEILLNAKADVNAKNRDDCTTIFLAAKSASLEVIRTLISQRADVNIPNKNGDTALMNALQNNEKAKVIKALLDAGANVNATNNDGSTALILAAKNETVEIIEMLVNKGANVNAKNNRGETPLLQVASTADKCNERVKIAKLFLAKGAVGSTYVPVPCSEVQQLFPQSAREELLMRQRNKSNK